MMNNACQAIAAAKHSPKILRLRSHHAVNGPGTSIRIDDAAKARYKQGTAHLTDGWIMEETPAPVDRSVRNIAMTTVAEIGAVMSQNSRHPLKISLLKISPRAAFTDIRHSLPTSVTEYIP